jgi:hypothetical protein
VENFARDPDGDNDGGITDQCAYRCAICESILDKPAYQNNQAEGSEKEKCEISGGDFKQTSVNSVKMSGFHFYILSCREGFAEKFSRAN